MVLVWCPHLCCLDTLPNPGPAPRLEDTSNTLSHSHAHTHTHTLATHTHTHTQSRTHTHTTHSLTHIYTHRLSLSLSLSHTHGTLQLFVKIRCLTCKSCVCVRRPYVKCFVIKATIDLNGYTNGGMPTHNIMLQARVSEDTQPGG